MSDERLKEIKDSIKYKMKTKGYGKDVIDEEQELYNEVIRLREIINKATDKLYCWGEALRPDFQLEMFDILKENNNGN